MYFLAFSQNVLPAACNVPRSTEWLNDWPNSTRSERGELFRLSQLSVRRRDRRKKPVMERNERGTRERRNIRWKIFDSSLFTLKVSKVSASRIFYKLKLMLILMISKAGLRERERERESRDRAEQSRERKTGRWIFGFIDLRYSEGRGRKGSASRGFLCFWLSF